jgi:hypothetical protein
MATATLYQVPSRVSASVEASECDVKIRSAVKAYNSSFGSLAYWSWKLKRINGYEELGFDSEHSYYQSLGISRSWYYHAVSFGQHCSHMTLEEMESIPAGIAELMLSIKPEIRKSYDWASEAKALSYTQFLQNVETRNQTAPGPERTPMTVLSIRVPASAKQPILDSLSDFQEKHQLESIGQSLEFVVADKFDRPNIMGHLVEAMQLMEGVSRSISRHEDMKNEKEWLTLARGRVKEVYEELVKTNREVADEIYEEAVYETEDAGSDQED